MKTKSFLLFSTSVFATSIFLIVFHTQQPQSIQSIVTQTHQHIKDFQLHPSQEKLKDVEQSTLVARGRYFQQLGLEGALEAWRNVTAPALVSHAHGDGHAAAVAFIRAAARLPHTVLMYNLGLTPHSLAVVSNYCNSSKCVIMDLDLSVFPSHVADLSIHAFRPIIIQHALSRVGGVIFAESGYRWGGSGRALAALWARAAAGAGVLAWPRRAAVTSLTHPRMFHYFHAAAEDFLFVQMLDVSRVLVAARPGVPELMKAWIQCAVTLDCIMPIGAQSGGCRFDKKPQYRYSGCHGHDASALSIILGQRFGFEEAAYTAGGDEWRAVDDATARREYDDLLRNSTEADAKTERTEPAPANS
ncbi:uncharacterized protein LOC105386958 isoform X1 [Plutella xylostella]|uniref:uncharacterized protein LOC105386958 isoform X1 n=1 Tax=Plutella xylostella TaxID=51655 RepID=UPI002032DF08|nr:uncharacterized protein LOC105386958 isoform X1 [Plutella xylostella]